MYISDVESNKINIYCWTNDEKRPKTEAMNLKYIVTYQEFVSVYGKQINGNTDLDLEVWNEIIKFADHLPFWIISDWFPNIKLEQFLLFLRYGGNATDSNRVKLT